MASPAFWSCGWVILCLSILLQITKRPLKCSWQGNWQTICWMYKPERQWLRTFHVGIYQVTVVLALSNRHCDSMTGWFVWPITSLKYTASKLNLYVHFDASLKWSHNTGSVHQRLTNQQMRPLYFASFHISIAHNGVWRWNALRLRWRRSGFWNLINAQNFAPLRW